MLALRSIRGKSTTGGVHVKEGEQTQPKSTNPEIRDSILAELSETLPAGFHRELLELYLESPCQQTIETFLKEFCLNLPDE